MYSYAIKVFLWNSTRVIEFYSPKLDFKAGDFIRLNRDEILKLNKNFSSQSRTFEILNVAWESCSLTPSYIAELVVIHVEDIDRSKNSDEY